MILRYISFAVLLGLHVMANDNIRYAKSDMHAQTIPKGQINLSLEYDLLNDTVDILNLKQSELASISNIGAIGDLKGYGLKLRYGITQDFMISFEHSRQDLSYLSSTMTNKKDEIYTRYNLVQSDYTIFNNGFALDVGYIRDRLDDFKITDINSMNNLIAKFRDYQDVKLAYNSRRKKYSFTVGSSGPYILNQTPYASLENGGDDSLYLRGLIGFHKQKHTVDFFLGYKYTKITNRINTTDEIVKYALDKNKPNPRQNLDRNEGMVFAGFNYSLDMSDVIYEIGYQYDRLFRDAGLDYINYNHIINASISYALTRNLLLSVGAKAMYRQFNGVVPYMYNKYTQTSFDHKYGYANVGFTYIF